VTAQNRLGRMTPNPGFRSAMLAVVEAHNTHDRARAIGDLHSTGPMPETAELLIDAEEDPYLRAVLVGLLLQLGR